MEQILCSFKAKFLQISILEGKMGNFLSFSVLSQTNYLSHRIFVFRLLKFRLWSKTIIRGTFYLEEVIFFEKNLWVSVYL